MANSPTPDPRTDSVYQCSRQRVGAAMLVLLAISDQQKWLLKLFADREVVQQNEIYSTSESMIRMS